MAEIKIEKKKTIWPWILLGLIVAAVLLYFLVIRDNDNGNETQTEETYISNDDNDDLLGIKEGNGTVAAFVDFVDENRGNMSLDHEYTNGALTKLIDATGAMADETNHDLNTDLEQAREHAKMIKEDPYETSHADKIRKAGEILAGSLHKIQQEHYPSLQNEAEAVKNAASEIKPDVLTLDQKEAVKDFFDKAADLLQKMN